VWIDDALPAAAKASTEAGGWQFVGQPDHPVQSGSKSTLRVSKGLSQHYFTGSTPGLRVGEGDKLFCYVYLDPLDLPKAIMIQFNKGNCFASGNIAMAHVHTWYLCCFDPTKMDWDIAVLPTIDGKITAKLHGDTFAILKESKQQDAAFKVLSQMVKDPELNVLYGGMPAVESERPAFFSALDQRVAPNKIDWSVAEEMLNYPDLPNHESWLPNLAKANSLLATFRTTMDQNPDLNLAEAIDKLKADLDEAYSSAP